MKLKLNSFQLGLKREGLNGQEHVLLKVTVFLVLGEGQKSIHHRNSF